MSSISWCMKQKKGISLVNPNRHLEKSYLKQAMDDLNTCSGLEGDWKLITGYYACYNALYSLLMKCGIKCEIHDCTIRLMSFLGFSKKEADFMRRLKEKRIEVQYYLKKGFVGEDLIREFVVRCREILEEMDDAKINKLRGILSDKNK